MDKKEYHSEEVCYWSARKMPPIVIVYVVLIFITFMAISYWGLHSTTAAKTLAFTAIGSIVPLMPLAFARIEYQLTKQKLESRSYIKKATKPYAVLFKVDQVNYIVRTGSGFKYYLKFEEKNGFKRFVKKHVSDKYGGEVKIEKPDVEKILAEFKKYGIAIKGKNNA